MRFPMPSLKRVALIIETSVIYGRRILSGVARYLRAHGQWSVFLEQHELGTPPPRWLKESQWDGILCRPTDPALARTFRRMGVPVVDLNDLYDDLKLPWVGSDHAEIGAMGARHLLERGFRHFAFCGYEGELWARQRRDGFLAALAEAGFPGAVYESKWRGANTPRWDDEMEKVGRWIRALPKPVGIMACNDVRGLNVLDGCQRVGLMVPEECAVVGVDSEEILCDLCNPPLSSVAPGAECIGYAAAELLDALMAGKSPDRQRVMIVPEGVITRQSSDSMALKDQVVAAASRYIREHALEGCRVDEVLRHLRISRGALENRFRKALGRSPKAEIRRIQVSRIQRLLVETDFTLERIAELTGFEHPEYMSVLFKRETGVAPGAYRRRLGIPGSRGIFSR